MWFLLLLFICLFGCCGFLFVFLLFFTFCSASEFINLRNFAILWIGHLSDSSCYFMYIPASLAETVTLHCADRRRLHVFASEYIIRKKKILMQYRRSDTNCRKPQWCTMLKEIPSIHSQEMMWTHLFIWAR